MTKVHKQLKHCMILLYFSYSALFSHYVYAKHTERTTKVQVHKQLNILPSMRGREVDGIARQTSEN